MDQREIFMDEEDYLQQCSPSGNLFNLTEEQKNNINRRIPRGFSLQKINNLQLSETFSGDIEYVPLKREPRVAS